MTRDDVYKLIDGERTYQNAIWNEHTTASKGLHTPTEFLCFMQDYLTQAIHQVSRNGEPEASWQGLDTIRKIAALAVACMEQHGAPARKA